MDTPTSQISETPLARAGYHTIAPYLLPLVFAPFRALIGHRSDMHRSVLGWRRVPYIYRGTMFHFGGLAIMPFALLVLSLLTVVMQFTMVSVSIKQLTEDPWLNLQQMLLPALVLGTSTLAVVAFSGGVGQFEIGVGGFGVAGGEEAAEVVPGLDHRAAHGAELLEERPAHRGGFVLHDRRDRVPALPRLEELGLG